MMRVPSAVALLTLLGVSLAGQTTQPAARFEVADVRPSAPVVNGPAGLSTAFRVGVPRNGRYEIRRATMVDLVRTAYGVEADKVVGGPHWLEMDRFDVTAKVPPGTTRDTVKPMLQALLAERFELEVRQQIVPVAAHAIVRAGELRLKEAPPSGVATCPQNIQTTTGAIALTMSCRGMAMTAFAEQLSRAPGVTGVTGPVVDETGLSGGWDFDLRFTPSAIAAQAGGQTFAQALAQLGLKLEPKQVPLPTITVERVNRTPTPNDTAALAALPPGPPAEFEVAEIKPAAPGSRINIQNLPNGQLNLTAVPLRLMVSLAYMPPNDSAVIGPRSLDNPFDLIAKMSVDQSQQLDPEMMGPMLQKLLADRLNLKARWEERPTKGYSLVTDGPHKLVKADPAARTRCAAPPAASRPPTAGPSQTLNCQNITMGEFAEYLMRVGGTLFQVPVLDETGLEGRWNFSITFSPPGLAQALANARAAAPPGAIVGAPGSPGGLGASDPTGVMTLEEAIDRQMGLKLRSRQRTGRVLVVDYVEEKPTPNQ